MRFQWICFGLRSSQPAAAWAALDGPVARVASSRAAVVGDEHDMLMQAMRASIIDERERRKAARDSAREAAEKEEEED